MALVVKAGKVEGYEDLVLGHYCWLVYWLIYAASVLHPHIKSFKNRVD